MQPRKIFRPLKGPCCHSQAFLPSRTQSRQQTTEHLCTTHQSDQKHKRQGPVSGSLLGFPTSNATTGAWGKLSNVDQLLKGQRIERGVQVLASPPFTIHIKPRFNKTYSLDLGKQEGHEKMNKAQSKPYTALAGPTTNDSTAEVRP